MDTQAIAAELAKMKNGEHRTIGGIRVYRNDYWNFRRKMIVPCWGFIDCDVPVAPGSADFIAGRIAAMIA